MIERSSSAPMSERSSDEVIPILSEAEALVMEMVTEQNRIHDKDPPPVRYRAAFGVVAKMIVYLKRRDLYKHCCPHSHVRLRDGVWRCIACNSSNVRGEPLGQLATLEDRPVADGEFARVARRPRAKPPE